MKGIIWDDLSEGVGDAQEEMRERARYDKLKESLIKDDVELEIYTDSDHFFEVIEQGGYDFVMVDCYKGGDAVGPKYAEHVKTLVSDPVGKVRDPDMPIFLLSRVIDSIKLEDIVSLNCIPVEKGDATLVAHRIRKHLYPLGRWTKPRTVFLIRRCTETTNSSEFSITDMIGRFYSFAKECGFTVTEIETGAMADGNLLEQVADGILRAKRIVALLTRDEKIEDSDNYLCRPNVYLETGMLLTQPFMQRKSLICIQENVEFPSDIAGKTRLEFDDSIGSLEQDIKRFLQSGTLSPPKD